MKRFIYLSTLALIFSVSAQASSLNIRFARTAGFLVTLDGQEYYTTGGEFRLDGLRAGRHSLMIASVPANRNSRRNPMPQVIYNGGVMVRPHTASFATLDHRGFHIDSEYAEHNNRRNEYQYDNRNDRDHDPNNGRNNDRYEDDDDYYNDGTGNRGGGRHYMNDLDFNALKQNIRNATFESTKKTIATAAADKESLSVNQVRDIIGLFDFESTKLEFAKQAYESSPDRDQFYLLSDAFTFDSSKEEIAKLAQR